MRFSSIILYSFILYSSFLYIVIMGVIKQKTAHKEHETLWRVRFRHLIEQGYSQSYAAEELGLPRTTAMKWEKKQASDQRIGKRTSRA
jgi:DNA-binding XRE family transcriptional regulator